MNLRQLEYLVAIAEDGSFRAAAHRLHVAAPSISQQIRLLELELGGPLLERLPRGARLTPAGRAFLPEARSALLSAQRAQRAGRAALALELAEIEIATVLSLAVGLLPPAIQRMCEAHPGMSVRLHEFHHREVPLQAPVDSPTYAAMREALEHFDPEAHVVPYCMSGGTDAKQFSRLGITGYGFAPLKLPEGFDYQALFH